MNINSLKLKRDSLHFADEATAQTKSEIQIIMIIATLLKVLSEASVI